MLTNTNENPSSMPAAELRETMLRAEKKIGEICIHFERLTGVPVRGLNSVRWPSGDYTAQILLGSPAACAAPPAAGSAPPSPCERG